MYMCMYMYTYMHMYIYLYMYMYLYLYLYLYTIITIDDLKQDVCDDSGGAPFFLSFGVNLAKRVDLHFFISKTQFLF